MLSATNAPLSFYGILQQLFIQLSSISQRGGIATMLQIKHIIFFFSKELYRSILCITAYFPSFSFTLWQLGIFWSSHFTDIDLTDPEVQAAAAKIQGAFKGFKSRNNQNQPWACLVFILVREKLPFLEIIWASQVSRAQTPPKRIFKLCPYVGDCIVIYSISPYCVPLNTFYLYLTSSLILNKS